MSEGKVSNHHAKRLGLIHAAENLPAHPLQLVRNLVGQRKDERSVDTLEWNVQPRAVIERQNLLLGGLGRETHDDMFGKSVLLPDFQNGKELVEMALGEF